MILDIFPLLFLIFYPQCICHSDYYLQGGISFLVQSIWSSVGFLYVHGHLFLQVREVFFYNFVEDIYWPFKLGLFTLFYTYYPQVWSSHCVLDFLDVLGQDIFAFHIFFDCCVNVFYSIFWTQDPYFFPRFSISRVVSLCDFFIVSTSTFRCWMVLFNSFTFLYVFSCNSLRNFCVSSLRVSTCLPVYLCSPVFL